jgi:hypothetical protein
MDQESCANEKDCEFSCVQEMSSDIFCKAVQTNDADHRISWVTFGMVEILPKVNRGQVVIRQFRRASPMQSYGGKDRGR